MPDGEEQTLLPVLRVLVSRELSTHEHERDAVPMEVVDAALLAESERLQEVARAIERARIVGKLREREARVRVVERLDRRVHERSRHALTSRTTLHGDEVQSSRAARATEHSEDDDSEHVIAPHACKRASLGVRRTHRTLQGIERSSQIMRVVKRACDDSRCARQQRLRDRDDRPPLAHRCAAQM
jgi:hypothetical protein